MGLLRLAQCIFIKILATELAEITSILIVSLRGGVVSFHTLRRDGGGIIMY